MAVYKLPGVFLFLLSAPFLAQATTVTLAVSQNPSVLGAPVTLTATVTPSNATGKVTFYDGVTVLGTKTLTRGAASFLTGILPAGSRSLRAYYAGDSSNAAASSNVVAQTVNAKPSVELVKGPLDGQTANGILGDFNGDGIADLAVASEVSYVLLGKGDGTFQGISIGNGAAPQVGAPVATADFNGDGKADLIVELGFPSILRFLAGNGDGTFQNGVQITQVASADFSPVVADFNGDGKPDLAVVTVSGVNLLLGNGDGTFQSGTSLTSAGLLTAAITGVSAGDFNGDGKPDLAVSAGTTISILLGNGDGTFRAPLQDPAGVTPSNVVVADLNQDGKADLIILSSSTKVAIQLGNGDGTFRAPSSFEVGFSPGAATVGDFNGDGIADVAAGTPTTISPARLSILLGKGDGTFQPPVNYPTFFAYRIVPIAADFNGDGKTDLYAGGILLGTTISFTATAGTPQSTPAGTPFPIQLQVTLRDGGSPVNGASVTFGTLPSPSGASAALSSTTAITDGSGVARMTATANQQPGSYAVVASFQNVSAFFALTNTAGPPTSLTVQSGSPQSVALGAAFPKALSVRLTDSAGNPASGMTVTFAAPSSGATATLSSSSVQTDVLGVASLMATAGSTAGSYTVTANFGSLTASFSLTNALVPTVTLSATPKPSTFGAPVTLTATVTPPGATGRVTFYDGATVLGTKPLVSGTAAFSTILLPTGTRKLSAYYSGDANYLAGNAAFTQTVKSVAAVGFDALGPRSLPFRPMGIAVGDFNGDGKADLAIPNSGLNDQSASVAILLGKGDGTFLPPASYPFGTGNISIAVADFNGDGTPDIVVSSTDIQNNGHLGLLFGNGDGTFRSVSNVSSPYGPVMIADFNVDGKPDLLLLGSGAVLTGNGDGTFRAPLTIPNFQSFLNFAILAQSVLVGDFNGDGIPDIVAATPFLEIALGNGDGTFRPLSSIGVGVTSGPIALGDFNGDGNLDLLTAGSSVTNSPALVLGNGDGTFQPPIGLPIAGSSFIVSDFNGDGLADIAVAGFSGQSSTVSVLTGNGDGTFHLALNYTTANPLGFVTAADFNGDGRVDLAGIDTDSNANDRVAILLGVPAGVIFTATGGTPQAAVTGSPFGVSLQVTVVQDGTPVNGAIVNFSVPSSGPSAKLSSTTAVTNTAGISSVNAIANNITGSYAVTASY